MSLMRSRKKKVNHRISPRNERLFQIRGAAIAKARSAKIFSLVLGTDKSKASIGPGA